jgi:hypothetical protein
MIYRFTSPATGDVVMLGPNGDELLRILGREPAPKGIIEPAAMAAAMATLEAAVLAAETPPGTTAESDTDADAHAQQRGISLRQRIWPMREMLRRALAENKPVVWGV